MMPFEGEEQSIDDVRTDHAAGEDDGLDEPDLVPLAADEAPLGHRRQIGRASCRERVCQYV